MKIKAWAKWYQGSFVAFKSQDDTKPILDYINFSYCPHACGCGKDHAEHSVKTFKDNTIIKAGQIHPDTNQKVVTDVRRDSSPATDQILECHIEVPDEL